MLATVTSNESLPPGVDSKSRVLRVRSLRNLYIPHNFPFCIEKNGVTNRHNCDERANALAHLLPEAGEWHGEVGAGGSQVQRFVRQAPALSLQSGFSGAC